MINFYDRTSYWLFVMEIPHLRGGELLSAVKIKLGSLYPGSITERNIQIRKNGTKKWSYLVFVLYKNTGNTMLPLSPLFALYVYAQETVNVLYADKKWLDYIRIEKGAIISSTVKIRNEDSFLDDVKGLCDTEKELIIYCDKKGKNTLSQLYENNNIRFLDNYAELKKLDAHKISLFSEKSPVVKQRRLLAAVALFFLIVFGSLFLFLRRENEKERNIQLRIEQEQRQRSAFERERENQRLFELKTQYQEIAAAKTAVPFDIAAVIAECAQQQTRIQSATFNGGFFQIEGITDNSLSFLRKFENHRLISDVRLHQAHPSGILETFSLSGTVQTGTISVDESLPASEQITILENLIAAETNYASSETQLTPSEFGEAVKEVFSKWGCTANLYQFTNNTQYTEVEYSLLGSGNGFFNALYEIKTKHRLWDISLAQIRNLYPRNMLDVVIRIKTEYGRPKTDNIEALLVEAAGQFPVANISRNYFMPAPAGRPSQPAAEREQRPVPTPSRAERVSWLEFVGSVNDENNNSLIYVKNTRTGEILRLEQSNTGSMRYSSGQSGIIIAYIDDNIYEINRR